MKESDFKKQIGIHSQSLGNISIELEALNHLSNNLSNFIISKGGRSFSSKEDKDIYYEIMYYIQVLNLALNTTTNNLEKSLNEIRNLRKELA